MASAAVGMIGGSNCWTQFKNRQSQSKKTANDRRSKRSVRVCCVSSSSSSSSWVHTADPYRTLQIQPGASESEVRKAFRQLALQYHPDVCRGNNCGVQFHQINEAYDFVMSNLRGESTTTEVQEPYYDQGIDEPMRGMNDPDWDMWEEWMGWEGAGIRDYTSHINPYI